MTRLALSTTILALATASALTAQLSAPVAYPQNGTDSSTGQIVPLGYSSSSSNFDEGRWQQLIPARYLPSTGGAILGLDVLSQATITSTYPSLTITMSLVPPGAPLSYTFAANLPSPMVVFSHTAQTFSWVARTWQTIPLDVPFFYDGVSDLVVDFQKTFDRVATPPTGLAHHQTSGDPGRNDLPTSRYDFGALGSGASTSTNARYATGPMKMRFQFAGLPTTTVTGWRGGTSNYVFAVGQQFDATLHGTTGAVHGSLISFGWSPAAFPIPGIGGLVQIDPISTVAYSSGPIGPTGEVTLRWSIPNNPGLVGAMLTFQGVSQDMNGRLVMTNATDCIIRS